MNWRRWLGLAKPEPPSPEAWHALTSAMPLLLGLQADEAKRLRHMVGEFVADKAFYGADDVEIDDRIRLLIAAQACLLVLNLGLDWYRGWHSIIVYPSSFRVPYQETDRAGVVHEGEHIHSGEAWPDGPVVLSWPDVVSGATGDDHGNLVIHEFAHKLDQRDGAANGMPPLPRDMSQHNWSRAFGEAFDDLNDRLEQGRKTLFGDYEASAPAEFFAAVCELFFVRPDLVHEDWPAVYAQLRRFFRQDPLGRFSIR